MKKKIISSSIGSLIKSVISDLVIGSVCLGVGGIACTHDAQGMVQSSSVRSSGSGQSSSLPAVELVREFIVNAFTGEVSSYNEGQIHFILNHSGKHFVRQKPRSAENGCKNILTTLWLPDYFENELIEGLVKRDNVTYYEISNKSATGFPKKITFKVDITQTWPAAKLMRRTADSRSNITFLDSLRYLVLNVEINARGVYKSSMNTSYVKPYRIKVQEEQLDEYCSKVKEHLKTRPQHELFNYPWASLGKISPFYRMCRIVDSGRVFDSIVKAISDKKGEIITKRYDNAKVKFDDNVSAWVSTYDVPIGDLSAAMQQLLHGAKTQIFHRNEHNEVCLLAESDLGLKDMARLVVRWTDSGTSQVITGGTMYVIPQNMPTRYKSTELVMPDEDVYAPAEITTISSAESKLSAPSPVEMAKIETSSPTTKQEPHVAMEAHGVNGIEINVCDTNGKPLVRCRDLCEALRWLSQGSIAPNPNLDIWVLICGQTDAEYVSYEKFRDMRNLPIEEIRITQRSSNRSDDDIARLLGVLKENRHIKSLKSLIIEANAFVGDKDLCDILRRSQDSIETVQLNVGMELEKMWIIFGELCKCKRLVTCALPEDNQLLFDIKGEMCLDFDLEKNMRMFLSMLCNNNWSRYDHVSQEQHLKRLFPETVLKMLRGVKTIDITKNIELEAYLRILLKSKKLKELKVSNKIMYTGGIYALINLVSEVPLERLVLDCDMMAANLSSLLTVLGNSCKESSLIECILPKEGRFLVGNSENEVRKIIDRCSFKMRSRDAIRKLTPEELQNLNWLRYDLLISCANRKKMQLESEKKVRTRRVKNGEWYETELITSEDSKITGIKVMQPGETIETALDDIAGISITGYCNLLPILESLVNKPNLKELIIAQNFVTDEEQKILNNVIEKGAIETIDVSKCGMDGDLMGLHGIKKAECLREYRLPEKILVAENAELSSANEAIVIRDEKIKQLTHLAVCVVRSIIERRQHKGGKKGNSYGAQSKFMAEVTMRTKTCSEWKTLTPLMMPSELGVTEVKISSSDSTRGTVPLCVLFKKLFDESAQCRYLNTLEFSKVMLLSQDVVNWRVDSLKKITLNCYMECETFLTLAEKMKSSTSLKECDLRGLEFWDNPEDEQREKILKAVEAIRAQCEANNSRNVAGTKAPKKTKTTKSKTHHKKKKK